MSLTQNISIWDTVDFQTKEETSYVEFPYDPLAGVCACIRAGKAFWDFGYNLEAANSFGDTVVTAEDEELATKIRRYFANKQLMYLMKKNNRQQPSEYRKKLASILENDRRVNRDHYRVLITLPQFYNEEKSTLKLMENFRSLDESYEDNETIIVDEEFTYVGQIHRYSQKVKSTRFYFSNNRNQLLLKEIDNKDCGKNLMNFVVKTRSNIKIQGTAVVRKNPGLEFRLFSLHDFELV